ncbi:helix-turn-helix transcriptional regulator [Streptomyces ipomoeae]|uniref:helix-turn-helix domain-containing protein n=3 Tax=Streptomyces ipomoeae TaxID=103232 RepID=UPI0002D6783B|nr:helix-turn-helix transcriptional regulator [Streptomyces ipomoeae]MDX2821196.1 helix-turn-helix transcriptional regulator [Streptomyces ipomoeae]
MDRGVGGEGTAGVGGGPKTASWSVRAGWLLRAHRIRHQDAAVRTGASFAALLGARGGAPGPVSASTVSRWESGRTPVPYAAVRRYEEVLGLPPYLLLAVIETMARYQGGAAAEAFAADAVTHVCADGRHTRRVDLLLDKILDDEQLTSGEWDELTARLVSGPVPVSPARVRRAVTERLLEETLVSAGLPWMRRFEALSRLLASPAWAADAVAVCADVGSQTNHAALIEAVCALDGSGHPDAARHVLRQLRDPTNDDSFHGALMSCVRKVQRRHFGPAQSVEVLHVVGDVLRDPSAPPETAELAAVLLPRLPAPPRYAAVLARAAGRRAETRHVAAHGLLTDPGTARVAVARLLSRMPVAADPSAVVAVLRDIVDDILHHPVSDVRLYNAMLLRASPYQAPLAAALAAELTVSSTLRSERAVPILHALRVLGGPQQRAAIARLTIAEGLPAAVVRAAIHALGHIGGRSPEHYWRTVLRRHTDRWALTGAVGGEAELKRLVYAFGMAGELGLLVRLLREEAAAAPARAMSAWWTSLPQHIRVGALV